MDYCFTLPPLETASSTVWAPILTSLAYNTFPIPSTARTISMIRSAPLEQPPMLLGMEPRSPAFDRCRSHCGRLAGFGAGGRRLEVLGEAAVAAACGEKSIVRVEEYQDRMTCYRPGAAQRSDLVPIRFSKHGSDPVALAGDRSIVPVEQRRWL